MGAKFTGIRRKEVVNSNDGRRLGFICDLIVDTCNGHIEAIVVPGCGGVWNFWRGSRDVIIPWCKICRFGEDVILVDLPAQDPCCRR